MQAGSDCAQAVGRVVCHRGILAVQRRQPGELRPPNPQVWALWGEQSATCLIAIPCPLHVTHSAALTNYCLFGPECAKHQLIFKDLALVWSMHE